MVRVILASCLAFLLLAFQQEALVHAFQHDALRFAQGKVVAQSADKPCGTCGLVAGGALGIAGATPCSHAAPALCASALRAPDRIDLPQPRRYLSRAPPQAS